MTLQRLSPLFLAGAALLPLSAGAQTYGTLDASASTLGFAYSQMGVSLEGKFPKFEATLRYDPAKPLAASTVVEVPLKQIDTGSEEGDDEVQGTDWFASAAHPLARFESTAVKQTAPGRLEVTGTLSIKGKQRVLTVPVTVVEQNGRASFDGQFQLNRTDFDIGSGMWAKDDVVAHAVTVSFHLVTTPSNP
jgi:polyisoprenoid-binding protein YceI